VPNPLLRLDQVAVGYGGRAVLTRMGLSLVPGERIGLLGPNGAGKSTLIKLLAGELAPLAGQCEPAKELKVGYFAQHQLEQLDPEASPLLHLQRLDRQAPEQALRDFLGAYAFQGERAGEPVAPLSGGEKARLVLALLIYQRPNLLLLDEPTNHLDLEMRHALTLALQDYEGAVVLVSHDRHLLRTVCDELLLVADGRVEPFAGDLNDYRRWLTEHSTDAPPEKAAPVQPHSADARKERRRQEAERRKQLQPMREQVQRLEAEMDRLGVEKAELERQLADPALYDEQQKPRLKEALQRQAQIERRLAAVEADWMAAAQELESAEAT
jgi:ATP-binding cassette subfamily F protein 3